MVQGTGKYTVITGASSGIGYETAKAFAERGKNLVIAARRKNNLERLKREILGIYPDLDIVIRSADLSVPENVYQFYEGLRDYEIETWINNAGFGNYDSVADQDLNKIRMMLNLNIEALTILSSLYVRDYKDVEGTQLINVSSCGGYTIVPTAVTYCAAKFYVSTFTEGLARELEEAGAKMKATARKRDAQNEESIAEYRRNHRGLSGEALAEARAAFGEGATVVNILTGERTKL